MFFFPHPIYNSRENSTCFQFACLRMELTARKSRRFEISRANVGQYCADGQTFADSRPTRAPDSHREAYSNRVCRRWPRVLNRNSLSFRL